MPRHSQPAADMTQEAPSLRSDGDKAEYHNQGGNSPYHPIEPVLKCAHVDHLFNGFLVEYESIILDA